MFWQGLVLTARSARVRVLPYSAGPGEAVEARRRTSNLSEGFQACLAEPCGHCVLLGFAELVAQGLNLIDEYGDSSTRVSPAHVPLDRGIVRIQGPEDRRPTALRGPVELAQQHLDELFLKVRQPGTLLVA